MVHRIEKQKPSEYWKLEGSSHTHKDKRHSSDEEKKEDQNNKHYSSFEEKTDWHRIIEKESAPRESFRLLMKDIQFITFKSISMWRDHAAVETDLLLKNQSALKSAIIGLPRSEGLKLMQFKTGDALPLEFFGNGPYLTASILQSPKKQIQREDVPLEPVIIATGEQRPIKKEAPYFHEIVELFKNLSSFEKVSYTAVAILLAGFVLLMIRFII